jgi:hypothetical protein
VEVAAAGCPDVARDALFAPAEVVRDGDVRQEVEPELVAEVARGLEQPSRVDDERRLALGVADLDEAGDAAVVQEATPRSS